MSGSRPADDSTVRPSATRIEPDAEYDEHNDPYTIHHLEQLPTELLCTIVAFLVPPVAAPPRQWRDALALTTVAHSALAAVSTVLADSLAEELPGVAALEPSDESSETAWLTLLSAVRSPGCGAWTRMKTNRAVRPASDACTPLSSPPRLSGASLAEVDGRLVLFGGRKSETGETVDTVHVVETSWFPSALAQWDVCRAAPDPRHGRGPAPRCYHTGMRWPSGVLVFGGAGDGNVLFSDAWVLQLHPPAWRRLDAPADAAAACPTARSAHVCAASADGSTTVLHGGLGNDGTCSDAWRLEQTGASPASTTQSREAAVAQFPSVGCAQASGVESRRAARRSRAPITAAAWWATASSSTRAKPRTSSPVRALPPPRRPRRSRQPAF